MCEQKRRYIEVIRIVELFYRIGTNSRMKKHMMILQRVIFILHL